MIVLLLVVLIGIFLALFATQNTAPVTMDLLGVPLEDVPLFLIVLASVFIGVLIAWLISLVGSVASFFTLRGKERTIQQTKSNISQLQRRIQDLEVENARLKERQPSFAERIHTAAQH